MNRDTAPHEPKLLGELNGKWTVAFKLACVLVPLIGTMVGAIQGWMFYDLHRQQEVVTSLQEFRARTDANRFTVSDAYAMELRWQEAVRALRPDSTIAHRVTAVEAAVGAMDTKLDTVNTTLAKLVERVDELRRAETRKGGT